MFGIKYSRIPNFKKWGKCRDLHEKKSVELVWFNIKIKYWHKVSVGHQNYGCVCSGVSDGTNTGTINCSAGRVKIAQCAGLSGSFLKWCLLSTFNPSFCIFPIHTLGMHVQYHLKWFFSVLSGQRARIRKSQWINCTIFSRLSIHSWIFLLNCVMISFNDKAVVGFESFMSGMQITWPDQ